MHTTPEKQYTGPNGKSDFERILTIPNASELSGVPKHKLRRAIKLGLLRTYGAVDSRKYVKLSDIHALLEGAAKYGLPMGGL